MGVLMREYAPQKRKNGVFCSWCAIKRTSTTIWKKQLLMLYKVDIVV
jgi:hypothetical protein